MKPLLQDGYIVLDSDLQPTPIWPASRHFEVWPCRADAADIQRCQPDPALWEMYLVRLIARLEREVKVLSSVLSQKLIEEVSPSTDGRKNVAHGGKAWVSASPPSPPSPLPLGRARGAEAGVRALHPRACAPGYNLPPPMGL